MFALYCILFGLIYLIVNVVLVCFRNYKAHQFFNAKAPNLPVLPNPNIFYGHMYQVTQQQKNWKIITNLHEQYGPTFGFYMCNQPWVSTKDLDLIKLIEIDRAQKHLDRLQYGGVSKEFNDSIFQVNGSDWRRVRRAVSPAFSNHKVRSDEVSNDIKSVLNQLHGALELRLDEATKESGSRAFVMDVHDMVQRYALAVIFLVAYKQSDIIDFKAGRDFWVEGMEKGLRDITNPLIPISVIFPFLQPFCRFLVQFDQFGELTGRIVEHIIATTDSYRSALQHHGHIQRKLSIQTGTKERRFSDVVRQGNFKRRLVDTIIDSLIEKKISHDHFVGSLFFLLLAGFETTADTITCLVWHLAQQPEIQEKLRKSIIEEGIDCTYMMWCIQETVRWHPAVPLGAGRVLGEDVTVNGLHLPKGAFIMSSTYSIHHDSAIWPEADKFNPERWQHQSEFHPAAFMGFGLGPRNCVGGKLAIHEIKLVMQMLLTNYRIDKCSETCSEYKFSSPGMLYTLLDQPIKVRLVARAS